MKKWVTMAFIVVLILPVLAGKNKKPEDESWKNKKFTSEELKQYNGKNGKPVYVAVDGIVYDVTKSRYWKTGTHMKMHQAGQDPTGEIKENAPQGIHKGGKILQKMPEVGILVGLPSDEKKDTEESEKNKKENK